MGWQVAHREKDGKYRLWSTISDGWLTDWGTKQDIQRYIAQNYLWEYKKHVIEMSLSFPNLWPSKESGAYMSDDAGQDAYGAWLQVLVKARGEAYGELIENKYNEVKSVLKLEGEGTP